MINNFLLAKSSDHIGESLPKVVVACTKQTAEIWFGLQVVYCMTLGPNLFTLNLSAFTNKNTQVLTVSMEMVYMAES